MHKGVLGTIFDPLSPSPSSAAGGGGIDFPSPSECLAGIKMLRPALVLHFDYFLAFPIEPGPLLLKQQKTMLSKPLHIAPFLIKSNKDFFPKRSQNMIPHCGFTEFRLQDHLLSASPGCLLSCFLSFLRSEGRAIAVLFASSGVK